MSKKQARSAPRRALNRAIRSLNHNGGSGNINLRGEGDPVTLIRVILDFVIYTITEQATAAFIYIELWRQVVGSTLPVQEISGNLSYAENKDFYWAGIYPVARETTSDAFFLQIYRDMKGARKLDRKEIFVMRFSGSANVFVVGTATTFYKEN